MGSKASVASYSSDLVSDTPSGNGQPVSNKRGLGSSVNILPDTLRCWNRSLVLDLVVPWAGLAAKPLTGKTAEED